MTTIPFFHVLGAILAPAQGQDALLRAMGVGTNCSGFELPGVTGQQRADWFGKDLAEYPANCRHLRLPVNPGLIGMDFGEGENWELVRKAVLNTVATGRSVQIDLHPHARDGYQKRLFSGDPQVYGPAVSDHVRLCGQIAQWVKAQGLRAEQVSIGLLNEPSYDGDESNPAPYYERLVRPAVAAIRRSLPRHLVFVPLVGASSAWVVVHKGLDKPRPLPRLPDAYCVHDVHLYEPAVFTTQGDKGTESEAVRGLAYPLSTPNVRAIRGRLSRSSPAARVLASDPAVNPTLRPTWIADFLDALVLRRKTLGERFAVGEFGTSWSANGRALPISSALAWERAVAEGCRKRGIPASFWQWTNVRYMPGNDEVFYFGRKDTLADKQARIKAIWGG